MRSVGSVVAINNNPTLARRKQDTILLQYCHTLMLKHDAYNRVEFVICTQTEDMLHFPYNPSF